MLWLSYLSQSSVSSVALTTKLLVMGLIAAHALTKCFDCCCSGAE